MLFRSLWARRLGCVVRRKTCVATLSRQASASEGREGRDRPRRSTAASRSVALVLLLSACGAGAQRAESADDAATRARRARDAATLGVPEQCTKEEAPCLPPLEWAERLCQDVYPDVALYMFRRGTPWSRYYMRTGLNAVNGWGPTVHEDLVLAEEVIVINHRLNQASFQVEGSGGTYDVLRWNGACVTLDVNEVSRRAPRSPRHSAVNWRFLSDEMQQALRKDPKVVATYRARRKECRGVTMGEVTRRCQELDQRLGDVIAEYVRKTPELPPPSFHP